MSSPLVSQFTMRDALQLVVDEQQELIHSTSLAR
jgi:hypothetical protein